MAKINTNSNVYTIVYATVLVVIVAVLLAVVSAVLRPRQDANVKLDTQKQILASLNLRTFASDAEAQKTFEEVITIYSLTAEGGLTVSETDGLTAEGGLTVYVANMDGQVKFVLPVRGAGLWGPIWGYIALNEDKQTIYSVFFNHEGETPGLGGEIKNYAVFQQQFEGKAILGATGEGLMIEKTGNGGDVDCISGATITSKGVETMLHTCLGEYEAAGWFNVTNENIENNENNGEAFADGKEVQDAE